MCHSFLIVYYWNDTEFLTLPQGHGNQYYPGVQWDMRDSAWRYITILDLPFSLIFDTLLLPLDIHHGPY
ncbi:hypothetical protein SEESL791_008925 [Salmonella enterica subsp. enterica serovar Sloterdijk str. ATCC 15791]|nr:hypothetical protein SEESL791_008925 [Salmonella enterica subsp. enterica serovar Sloterdijk str. ATCC 15791]